MTTARVALECVGLAALLYLACFTVGWWLWRLTARHVRAVSVWTGAPIAGLAVGLSVSYYWAGHGGIDAIAPWLLVGGLLADVVLLSRSRRSVRLDRTAFRGALWPGGVAGGTALLFSWHHIDTFRIGRLSTGSLFLADLQNFAIIGDLLGREGIGPRGSIVGYDVSALAAATPGSSMFMSLASAWTGRPEFEASLPAALLCVTLVALAARDLGRMMLPWSELLPAMLAVAAASVSLLVYSTSHFPLSQLLAMSSAIALLVVVAEATLWERTALGLRRSAAVAICLTPIVLAYPHMGVLAPPFVVGVALAAAIGAAWWRRIASGIVVTLVGCAIVLLALPGATIETVDRLRRFSNARAGFGLTLLTPLDLLGFRSSFVAGSDHPNAVALFSIETALVALLVAFVLLSTRGTQRSRAALAGAAALGALGSYAVVFLARGASYEQWKWAAFVVPIFVVGAGSVVVWAGAVVVRRRSAIRRRTAFGLAALIVTALVVSGAAFAHDATREYVADVGDREVTKPWSLATEDIISIASGPAYDGVRSVNVELPEYSETSWAAYFLAPRRTFLASGVGIVSVPPLARWTLERTDGPFIHPPQSDVRPVNASYRLVRERPDRVAPGTTWIVGDCDGLYRFDGERWVGVERTPATGGFEITMTPEPRAPTSRVPMLVRAGTIGVDALLLEYLPRDRARIVAQHLGRGSTADDRRLRGYPQFTYGKPFELVARMPIKLSLVFDAITGEEHVESEGSVLFESTTRFVVPPTIGETVAGSNPRGLAAASSRFRGRIDIARPRTPTCENLEADGRS